MRDWFDRNIAHSARAAAAKEAQLIGEVVKAAAQKALGEAHPSTLTSMNNLAEVLSSQGKYEEAETMLADLVQAVQFTRAHGALVAD